MTVITTLTATSAIGADSDANISAPGVTGSIDNMATTIEEINAQLGVLADHVGDLYELDAVQATDISALQTETADLQDQIDAIDLTALINDAADPTATNVTYSVAKIQELLANVQQQIEDGLTGDATVFTDLGLVEDELQSLGSRVTILETKVADLESKFDSGTGKLLASALPDFVTGGLTFKGTFDATTDTLPTPAEGEGGNDGWMYTVSVGGSVATASGATPVQPGDTLISDGVAWVAIARVDAVTSVNGRTGAVVLTAADTAFTGSVASGLSATDAQAAINEIAESFKTFTDAFGNPANMGTIAALKARIQAARTDGLTTAAA